MPDNTIDWGQGSANNDIGWGKGPINNDLSWGMIGEDSYGHDETNLMGGSVGPINEIAPVISGTAERGETITSTTGTWTGVGTITYAYQWQRNGSNILGSTSSTYVLVAADDNANITCTVTATDDEGSRSKLSNTLGPVLGLPYNLTAPVLSGTEIIGEVLSVTSGTWQGIATITFAYQWRRDSVNIGGATSNTYTLVDSDYQTNIDCVVTATNGLGSASQDSNDSGLIAGIIPSISGVPTFSGTESVGETLTATAASTSGRPIPTRTWKWQRSANGTSGWADISGATSITYLLDAADENNYVRVVQIETNGVGSDSANSVSSGQILLVSSFIDTFGQPEIGLSLRDLTGTDPNVLRVRRDSDDAELDFKASEISDGTLENWVNEAQTFFDENFESSTGWTLRSGATISGGSLNLLNVTNSAEAAYKSFGSIPFQKVLITITVTDYVQGAIYVTNLGGGGDTSPNITANGTYTYEITLGDGNTNWGIGTSSGPTTLNVSNLKVEQLTANGLVRTWYDQSSNGNDANQATATNQPKIVSNGSLLTLNSKPCISPNGTSDNLTFATISSTTHYISVVGGETTKGRFLAALSGYGIFIESGAANNRFRIGSIYNLASRILQTQKILTWTRVTTDSNVYQNSVLNTNHTVATSALDLGQLFQNSSDVATSSDGKFQEIIIYASDKSASRAYIESNINNYYTIY